MQLNCPCELHLSLYRNHLPCRKPFEARQRHCTMLITQKHQRPEVKKFSPRPDYEQLNWYTSVSQMPQPFRFHLISYILQQTEQSIAYGTLREAQIMVILNHHQPQWRFSSQKAAAKLLVTINNQPIKLIT